ncbi:phenylacetate--CoA ligase family protein [Pseudofrankia saprophytica]|uniref:phenylacetate--CoA ligase family protein n=1 Tax=Pseudofrankia saprophytica TaxID=298655 RepID=UPI000234D5D5|nr:AMP-binding protein [Pseudofrankia saprophytica]
MTTHSVDGVPAQRDRDSAGVARASWLSTVDRYRSALSAPDDDRIWSRRLETASAAEITEIQAVKLRALVRYLHAAVPFYRRRFDAIGLEPGDIRGLEDLTAIPPVTKQDMAADLAEHPPWGTYTAVDEPTWLSKGWQIFASSGTTGAPRAFRYTGFDRETWAWSTARAMYAMGFRRGRDSAMLAFGYGPHVWLWGVHYGLNLMGIPIVTAGGLATTARVRFLDMYRPTILACTPSYALYLADVMKEMGLDPAETSVRHLFCAGEPSMAVPALRARLESTWQATLHEFYGCTEAAPSAGAHSCAEVSAAPGEVSLHLPGDTHLWEVVDPDTMAPVPAGERGVSVVTNLLSEASPQLRFVVGDYTRLGAEPCPCGRNTPRARGGFLGRADDMLNVRGVTLFPSMIEDAVRRVPDAGVEYEIVLTAPRGLDELMVRVEATAGFPAGDHGALREALVREIRSRAELRASVEILEYGVLPRTQTKARRVRDLRAETAA